MSQTSYLATLPKAIAGMIADNMLGVRSRSGLNKQAADIPFGVAVVSEGSSADAMRLPNSLNDKIAGIAMRDGSQNNLKSTGGLTTGMNIADGDMFAVMTSGRMYVQVEQDVAIDDPVYVREAISANDATLTQKGAFRKDGDTHTATDTAFVVKGAFYKTAASAGGFAVVSFDINASRT